LESPAIHEPRPRPLDVPPLREDLEAVRVDLVHDLHADVVRPAVLDEVALEPGVAPELREAPRALPGTVRNGDPADVVRDARGDDDHRDEEPEGIDDPKGLATVDLLAGIEALGFLALRI
jgi:hypothetical protein